MNLTITDLETILYWYTITSRTGKANYPSKTVRDKLFKELKRLQEEQNDNDKP